MKQHILFALFLCLGLQWAQAQDKNGIVTKKWGLTWTVPKNWTKSAQGADGFKFVSNKGDDEVIIKTFPHNADPKVNEGNILAFFKDEVDYMGEFAELQKEFRTTNLNGIAIKTYEDDEEPDLEDAEDPEDYEGYWTQVNIYENYQGRLVIVYLSEVYNRRRKLEKTFEEINQSFKSDGSKPAPAPKPAPKPAPAPAPKPKK